MSFPRDVNRAYSQDLDLLATFESGPRAATETEAEGLFSAGLLSYAGIDGEGFDSEGGTSYALNRSGEIMLRLSNSERASP